MRRAVRPRQWLAAMLCLLLPLLATSGVARAAALPLHERERLGGYGQAVEADALARGRQLRRDTTFAWGGLPLVNADLNDALESFLSALKLRERTQEGVDSGYYALDLLLQNISVIDLSLYAAEGLYYEQSNLLGGETVAFTPAEFSSFVSRISSRSGGAIPTTLDRLFGLLLQALAGDNGSVLPAGNDAFAAWEETALTQTLRQRPKLYIPGLYGTEAHVTNITRAEAIELARLYAALMVDNEALVQEAARPDAQEGEKTALDESALLLGDALRNLPEILAEWLPEDIAPAEFRTVYGAGGVFVAYQVEVTLPDGMYLYAEWVPGDDSVSDAYLSFSLDAATLSLLMTRETGRPVRMTGSFYTQTNRQIVQLRYTTPAFELDVFGTTTQNIETRTDREIITAQTSWTGESSALFGEGVVLTLSLATRDVATMSDADAYQRKAETTVRLKGLGFDSRDVLAVTTRTTLSREALSFPSPDSAIRPALLDDATLDAWTQAQGTNLIQVAYTVLGRLPPDVAAYLLSLLNAE